MCGGNSQQEQITNEQSDFYKKLSAQYDTIFGQNQAITGALTSAFQPILAAGPSQTGFAPGQETAMQTQNTENVATNYAQAQRATGQILAARGGGNTLLPSSVDANLTAQNANQAAAARAAGQNQITQANYAQGYQNWNTAANVLGSTAGLLNPTGYSAQATGAGGEASKSATALAASSFAPWGAAIGGLSSIAGMAAGGYMQGKGQAAAGCWIAAELYGGWYEPRTVLIRKWLMDNFEGHWLMNLYIRFGERGAAMVRKHRSARWLFTQIFNRFLERAST